MVYVNARWHIMPHKSTIPSRIGRGTGIDNDTPSVEDCHLKGRIRTEHRFESVINMSVAIFICSRNKYIRDKDSKGRPDIYEIQLRINPGTSETVGDF